MRSRRIGQLFAVPRAGLVRGRTYCATRFNERKEFTETAAALGKQALKEVVTAVQPDTMLA